MIITSQGHLNVIFVRSLELQLFYVVMSYSFHTGIVQTGSRTSGY